MNVAIYMGHPGENLRGAIRKLAADGVSVDVARLATALGVKQRTVYRQWDEANPNVATLARYADALNRFIPAGDPRRFTAESLQRGPDPEAPNGHAIPMPADLADTFTLGAGRLAVPPFDAADTVLVRVFGEVPCGDPLQLDDVPREVWPFHRSALPRGCAEANTVILIARGESMAPDIQPGDKLLVRTDVDWHVGDIVVANVSGAGCTVKRVVQGTAGLELRPDNPAEPPVPLGDGDQVHVVGVVVDWWRSMRGARR